ncbi:MAG TPA: hypothetical protein PLM55_09555 [Chitinophagales bacterium]|nr:hypothetical protein [Chitinophagales bacterium]
MQTSKLNIVERWLNYNPIDESGLAVFRILFSFFCLLSLVGVLRIDTLTIYPNEFYKPQVSFAYLFDKLPPIYFLYLLDTLSIVSLVGMLFGVKTQWSSILFGVFFICSVSFIYAFSKIGHQHFMPFTAIIFAFSGWGNKYSIDAVFSNKNNKKSEINVYPFFTLIIAFSFFTSGFAKLLGAWLDPSFQAVRYYQLRDLFFVERSNLLTHFTAYDLTLKMFWELMDYFIVAIEILPLFFMFYPKVFRYFMFGLASFHLGVYLVMNITFGMYPLIYLPFIADWKHSFLMAKIRGLFNEIRFEKKLLQIAFLIVLFVAVILHYILNFNDVRGLSLHRGVILVMSYIITLYFFLEAMFINYARDKVVELKTEK